MKLTSRTDAVDISLARNADGLLIKKGPFTITRNGPGGAPSVIGDGVLSTSIEYDSFGRCTRRVHTVAAEPVFALALKYDDAGRVTDKREQIAEQGHAFHYAYDSDGQLTAVTRDGHVFERYTYDANGNRASRQSGDGPAETALYDARDRIRGQAATAYSFDSDGFLTRRENDFFRYSTRGELLEVAAAGERVTYDYDGHGRRVACTDQSGKTEYLYGNPEQFFQVTAVREPAGRLTTYLYEETGFLLAMIREGTRYYVATDQVGTPRTVADMQGNLVKVLEFGSFGNPVADSDSGFTLPFGFPGGLVDPTSGLVRFGFRDYDPQVGRWTARDSLLFGGRQGNLYAYVGSVKASALPAGQPTRSPGARQRSRTVIPGATIGRDLVGCDSVIGDVSDFVNPLSDIQDAVDLLTEPVLDLSESLAELSIDYLD